MIAGRDIWMPAGSAAGSMGACLGIIRDAWPQAVFEDAATGKTWRRPNEVDATRVTEVFAYQDEAAAREWDELGAAPKLRNTMLHLIASDSGLTVVVDDPDLPVVARMLESIRRLLRQQDDEVLQAWLEDTGEAAP